MNKPQKIFFEYITKISTGTLALFIVVSLMAPMSASAAVPALVDLLSANNFTLLSKTGITNTGSHTTSITGNIGSSPITAAALNNVFCSEITGSIFGTDAAYVGSGSVTCFSGNPPIANKTTIDNAILDMGTAYSDAAGRTIPDGTELYSGHIGGQTFTAGLYKWSTDVDAATDVTISGSASDVWIFQIAGNLNIASAGSIPAGTKILLSGGADASHIFWQVGGGTGATLGTYSTFKGNILSAKQVIMQTGAVLDGKAFADTQITLDANTISSTASVITTTPLVVVVPPSKSNTGSSHSPRPTAVTTTASISNSFVPPPYFYIVPTLPNTGFPSQN